MTWIERTAYPQFKRLTSARVLHVFFTPSPEEVTWAEKRTSSPESCFALVLALKCFQKMARFPSPDETPDVVIDHVGRCLELAEGIWPDHGSSGSAKAHRKLMRQRQGVKYDAGRAARWCLTDSGCRPPPTFWIAGHDGGVPSTGVSSATNPANQPLVV
ncbi:DUF4158 domain-containing protein [Streptosporangium roseum]|uniref:DUF4158 domain-containing protein n=1 Tax=Streptosporangium roseum TaxID=2001 RepID=UPI00332BAEA2